MNENSYNLKKTNKKEKKDILGIFLMGEVSATLIIPKDIVRQCELDNDVIVEEKNGGIFIRKLADSY